MTYLRHSSKPKKGRATAALAVVLLLALFGVSYFFPRAIPGALYPVSSLFWKAESSSVGWFVYMGKLVQSKYDLVKQNKQLENEIAARDRAMLELDALKSENQSLKMALGRAPKGSFALGVILARPPVTPYDTMIIDAGSADGVQVGNRVYADGDTVIGDVAEVYSGQSKVSLYSTPGRSVSVLVGSSTIATEAIGRGGGNFVLTLPARTAVATGTPIRLSDIRPHVFGSAEQVTLDSTASIETVYFRSPVNISQLSFVEVDRSSHSAPQATTSPERSAKK